MISIHKSEHRGGANHGWLDAKHSFSFASYYNPQRMGFGPLRVINDDRIAPGRGFGAHAHRDMEIITYVLAGSLQHRDSMGNGSTLRAGDVQRMSAGSGVEHSEINPDSGAELKLLQIWIEPSAKGLAPGYAERHFSSEEKSGRLALLASPDGREKSLPIAQDALLFAGVFKEGEVAEHRIEPGRLAYAHVVAGSISVNGARLSAGDAAELVGEPLVRLDNADSAEILLFDLPR